jgi:beta-xylosidase
LTATSPPYWEGDNPGVKLWSSADLKAWRSEGLLIDRGQVPESAWYRDRFWAPEIHPAEGGFYLLFSCNKGKLHEAPFGIAIARADRVTGPYEVVSREAPLVERAIDGSLFTEGGRSYVISAPEDGLRIHPIDLPSCRLTGESWLTVTRGEEGTWDAKGIEGPYLIQRNGVYTLFYSSFTRGYEVGIATAPHLRGPWTKDERNPVMTGPVKIGHNAVFQGPDGRDWASYHRHDEHDVEQLAFSPLNFDREGRLSVREEEPA